MKEQADLKSILKAGKLTNGLDLERASILDNKLRLLAKDNPELMESRKRLRSIIKQYEKTNWSKESTIDEQKIKESDIAEFIAELRQESLEVIAQATTANFFRLLTHSCRTEIL